MSQQTIKNTSKPNVEHLDVPKMANSNPTGKGRGLIYVNDGLGVPANTPKVDHFTHTFKTDLLNSQDKQEKQRIVFKIGSSSITGTDGRVRIANIGRVAELVCDLVRDNYEVIIVSSGAVSLGCNVLNLKERPKDIVMKQACSAVGQGRIMRLYDDLFTTLQQPVAQVLLSRENLSQEHHYLNAMNTFECLLRLGIVAIVNENDTVAVQELKFGDNDNLSALVASVVRAHWLFLLTDVDALYTSNPNVDPNAKPIRVVQDVKSLIVDTSEGTNSGQWGTGGMATKLQAASVACSSGVRTCIVSTDHLEHVKMLLQGNRDVGTTFTPMERTIAGRKKWIAYGLVPVGTIQVDDGAALAICRKTSLFSVGITDVRGEFPAPAAVRIINQHGKEIGRGICNYNSKEVHKIKGLSSEKISQVLGYNGPACVIDRSNLAIFPGLVTPNISTNDLQSLTKMKKVASYSTGMYRAPSRSSFLESIPSPSEFALNSNQISSYIETDHMSPQIINVTEEDDVNVSAQDDAAIEETISVKSSILGYDVAKYGEPEDYDEDEEDAMDGACL